MRCECHVDVNRGGLAENERRGYTGSVRKFNYGDSIPLEAERAVKTVGRRECAPWIQGGSIRQQGGMRAHAIASLLLRAFEGRAACRWTDRVHQFSTRAMRIVSDRDSISRIEMEMRIALAKRIRR